jgi:hypothetical protein
MLSLGFTYINRHSEDSLLGRQKVAIRHWSNFHNVFQKNFMIDSTTMFFVRYESQHFPSFLFAPTARMSVSFFFWLFFPHCDCKCNRACALVCIFITFGDCSYNVPHGSPYIKCTCLCVCVCTCMSTCVIESCTSLYCGGNV